MTDDILPIPPLPDGLREAAQRGTLIPFIGAGVSRIAGCPSWADFADGALRFFVGQGKFSHGQLAQITHLNPRVKLSIALGLQHEHGLKIDFHRILYPIGRNLDPKGRKIYASLSRLGKIFVTTNYDEWLDDQIDVPATIVTSVQAPLQVPNVLKRNVVYKVDEVISANLNRPNTVIHLHGSLLDPDGMILTTADYIRHYANDRSRGDASEENRVLTFLTYLFEQKTILFVGYGLEELEILEYVIAKAKRIHPETRHYLLQPFFSHEHELMRSLKQYYLRECGIELIPYLRDQRDWDQLLEVLEEFARNAPASSPMYLQEFKEMESLLDD